MGFLDGASELPDYSKNQEVPISKHLGLEICIMSLLWCCIDQRNSRTSQDSRRGAMDLTCHLLVARVPKNVWQALESILWPQITYIPLTCKIHSLSSQIPKFPYSASLRPSYRVSLSASQSLSLSPISPSLWDLVLIRMEYHHTFFSNNFKRQIPHVLLTLGLHL